MFEETFVGQWCVVLYDGFIYPGIIEDADDADVRVNVMHRIGENRFFWPSPLKDIIWYEYNQVISLIPEPEPVTARHHQVDPVIWKEIQAAINEG